MGYPNGGVGEARHYDIGVGICPCHRVPVTYITTFVTGCFSVFTNDMRFHCERILTIGVSTCGHPTIALTGSGSVIGCYFGEHRCGDMGRNCGPYNVVTCSPNVIDGN